MTSEDVKPVKTVADDFLLDLLRAASPSGCEFEAQAVCRNFS